MQMIKMVGTIANFGKAVTPRIVKATINSKTGQRTNFEVKEGKQVISEDTAEKVLSMMTSVVAEGTGKNASVQGYAIGGKTGTSEDRSKYWKICYFIYWSGKYFKSGTSYFNSFV